MCGICLLIRQKVATDPRARDNDGQTKAAVPLSTPFVAARGATLLHTASNLPVEERMDVNSCALMPSSPDACSLTPCTCALAGLDMKHFLSSSSDAVNNLFSELIHNLRRRGPDTYGVTRRSFVTSCRMHVAHQLSPLMRRASVKAVDEEAPSSSDDVVTLRTEVVGVASVLGLRGHSTVAQPYDMSVATDAAEDREANSWDYRSSLMWNGEIFGGSLCPPPWGSDTVLLATRLSQMEVECVRLTTSYNAAVATLAREGVSTNNKEDGSREKNQQLPLLPLVERQRIFLHRCTNLFEQQVEGPYSFIFIATRLQLAVFGRDPLGRHSLLSHVRVTQPVSAAAAAADELDVELIVSSVGVQHHHPSACREQEEMEENEEAETPRQPLRNGERSKNNEHKKAKETEAKQGKQEPKEEALLSSSSALTAAHFGSGNPGVCSDNHHHAGTSKRPRHERRGLLNASKTAASFMDDAAADEENEEAGYAAGTGATGPHEVCWQEVGVTGLFAIPLQTPLVYYTSSRSSQHGAQGRDNEKAGENGNGEATFTTAATKYHPTDRLHPVYVTAKNGALLDGAEGTTVVHGAHVLLLHCPWQRTHHLVHPLLRTAALPMVLHEPPSFELILAHEEIAVLPEPLLRWASHLMKSMQPDGGLEQSWVDWAAAHYMLALAVSMHRRITVANSGAADGRDAQELCTARRRPLCILFSGGIDCTVIAALAHYILPVETPIELVNVAFGSNPEEAPDRVATFRSMEELLRLPLLTTSRSVDASAAGTAVAEREWRLVLVDVPSKASVDSAHIKDLLVPRHTVMDLDIGTALWYAARASGRMQILRRSDVDGAAVARGDFFEATPPMTLPGSPTTAAATSLSSARTDVAAGPCAGVLSGSLTVTLDDFSKHFRAYTSVTAVGTGGPWDGVVEGRAGGMADRPVCGLPSLNSSSSAVQLNANKSAEATASVPASNATAVTGRPANAPLTLAPNSEEVANTQKYQILVDVLVKEGRSGGGPLTPVLLSTLGKEYSLFLQPHIKRYGYKKLGSFLNDAAKTGYIKFVPDAPSKAVRLCRPADMERAAAVPPSPWFTTASMKAKGPALSGTNDSSSGNGTLLPTPGTFFQTYTSHAKVVLLGMGADETLGGYTRYRRFFEREGMSGARRELERDFARLWQRNLGRDDRVTMDSGREPRFPFLDEGVLRTLEWIVLKRRNNILATHNHLIENKNDGDGASGASAGANSCNASSFLNPGVTLRNGSCNNATAAAKAPLTHDELLRLALEPIVSFHLQPGEGDKRVLRRVASVLGLSDVTHLQKRAIQFGSRIAERKIKGTMTF